MDYWLNILALVGIYGILALSLNVICGMTGLLQLGHVGFFAVGAYAAALLSIYSTIPALGAFNLVLSCLAAMAAAAVLALVIGLPCLRLRGDYLAIATLGFAEILRLVLNNVEFPGCGLTGGEKFGGATGVALPSPTQYDISYSVDYANVWVILAVLAGTFLVLRNLKWSYVGRAMMCIREDEIAARSMGIHVPRYKVLAFVISAVFAGLAGALYAHNPNNGMSVVPKEFDLLKTVEVLLIVVLGGLGSMTGALLATVILVFLPEGLRFLPPVAGVKLAEHRQIVYALLLIALIRLMPNGIMGLGELPPFLRRLGGLGKSRQAPPPEAPPVPVSVAGILPASAATVPVAETPGRRGQDALDTSGRDARDTLFAAQGLTKRFGGLVAVDNVSLEIRRGQIVGFIGPNGAGKTTVFNLITALEKPDGGRTFFQGREITGKPAHAISRLGIARTFQNTRLPGQLSVLDNVKIACHKHAGYGLLEAAFRLPRFWRREREMNARALQLLEMFDLHGLGGQLASSLPYGKRRNLEIARALATEGSLLLLDEPAAGLNGRETADLANRIRRIRDEFGVTVLLIEHDMRMVMSLCEWIFVLDYGEMIAQGPPQQVKRDPLVIEAYLGPMRD